MHPTHRAIEAVWRIESRRLVASIARTANDLSLAEDLAQDALVAALEQWPESGIPERPGAWLLAVARRRAVDGFRREATLQRKLALIANELDPSGTRGDTEGAGMDVEIERHVTDDALRLVFTACHPLLSREARVALTLRTVAGLTTDEIARAYLVPSATLGQRISRAKKTLSTAGVPFEVPVGDELTARLAAVLEVVYLVFNEGYGATSGPSWTRTDLCVEAMRLGRALAVLVPEEPEVHGLVALMEFQASRLRARTDADGRAVPLDRQDRSRWDRLLITHATAALDTATRLGGPALGGDGPYTLQAAIAACHARATSIDTTDWTRIAALYGALVDVTRSPVVELNRAVAVSYAEGPAAALAIVDGLADVASMRQYHLLPATRGDLLLRLGRAADAATAFDEAAAMTANQAERDLLRGRADAARASRP